MSNIAKLIHEQELLKLRISKIIHGSVEIREKNNRRYLYVHFREDGISLTKYVGEYTAELHNLILENNVVVKELKKSPFGDFYLSSGATTHWIHVIVICGFQRSHASCYNFIAHFNFIRNNFCFCRSCQSF